MDLESTYPESLARRIADELWRRGAVDRDALPDVRRELLALEEEGWGFRPPELRHVTVPPGPE